jgi:tetratricopeptide (TPR) repeat protein
MTVLRPLLLTCVAGTLFFGSSHAFARRPAAKEELNRIINTSAGFLKNREPEMTEGEFALYEKVVAMLEVQPEFAMQLLQGMVAGKERPSPAFEFVLGNAHYNAGRRDEAEAHYRRAIERFPEYQRAWANLGVLYYSEERYDDAVMAFGKAVELGDSTAETMGLLAFALQRAGNDVGAEMAYLRATSSAPNNPDWIDGLCGLYIDTRQFGRAEPLIRQLIKLQPREPRHWANFASLLLAQDRPLEALVVLESARGLQLATEEMLLQLGDLYARQSFNAEALIVYHDVLKRNPEIGAKRLCAVARSALDTGHPDEAAKILASVEKQIPATQRETFLEARAELAMTRKDWPAARRDLEEALGSRPLYGPHLLRLGQVLAASGSDTAAQEYLDAATRQPESAYHAHLALADLELRARHFRACSGHLEQALAIEKSPALQEYLAKIKNLTVSHENSEKN